MSTQIEFREIPIFRYFETEARQKLISTFTRLIHQKGKELLTFGMPVPGIYILVDGEVAVSVPKIDHYLAVLHRGQSFGEMSLIEVGATASATITVISAEAKIVFCSSADFQRLLSQVEGCAQAFYKGAAHLLSARLRSIDNHINEEIAAGHKLIANHLVQSEMDRQITIARSEVNRTGDAMVSKLMKIMPIAESILQKFPAAQSLIDQLKAKLEEIFLVDAQNFDRISQQLDLILQHFENLKRVANGGTLVPVVGDHSLFENSKKTL